MNGRGNRKTYDSPEEAGSMLCTFFFGLAISTKSLIPVLLSVLVGIIWSQHSIIGGWMLKVRCDRDVQRWSSVHSVTSVPCAE